MLNRTLLVKDFISKFEIWRLDTWQLYSQGHPMTVMTDLCLQCARIVLDGFLYALEACLVNVQLA